MDTERNEMKFRLEHFKCDFVGKSVTPAIKIKKVKKLFNDEEKRIEKEVEVKVKIERKKKIVQHTRITYVRTSNKNSS